MIKELILTEEERMVVAMLETEAPHLLSYYMESIQEARKATLQRVVLSLIREDIAGIYSLSSDLHNISPNRSVPLLQDGLYKVYTLEKGGILFIPFQHMYAFQRIEGGEAVFHLSGDELRTYTSASELISVLGNHLYWGNLLQELENSSANLAMSLAYWKYRKYISIIEENSTIQYALCQKQKNKGFKVELLFEQLSILGHNLHPCAKTRMGMKAGDVIEYAPEFENPVLLRFVAVHRDYVEQRFISMEPLGVFIGLKQAMQKELDSRGLAMHDYVPIPVHPWQLQHVAPVVYKEELQSGIIIILPEYEAVSFALSSFRTVQTEKLAIKTAIRAQMTSTVRSISPQTANNAAVCTELISAIMEREQELSNTFTPLYEWGGGSFRSNDEQKKRNLSFVLRENVVTQEQELAITGTALYSESLVSGQPILLEILSDYQKTIENDSTQQAALQWFSEYATLTLTGFITLMVKYGIGLEGHLQNSIPVFKGGRIVRMVFRDWGGLRIYRPRLEKAGLSANFYPDSLILTSSLEAMQNKVFYTVIQNHLGELVYILCKYLKLPEEACWAEVRSICHRLFHCYEGDYKEAVEQERNAFFAPNVDYKALLTMRLQEGEKSYSYVKIENPLYKEEIS